MAERVSFPYTKHLLDRAQASEEAVCSKCLGLGAIVLMHRQLSPNATDVCPTCEGRGFVHRKNGYSDPLPALIGGRAAP